MTVEAKSLPKYVYGIPGHSSIGIHNIKCIKRFERTMAGVKLDEHTHGPHSLEFICLARGRQVHFVNHQKYAMRGGDVLAICPGDVHSSGEAPQEKGLTYWVELLLPKSGDAFLGLKGLPAKCTLDALRQIISEPSARHFTGMPTLQKHLDYVIYELVYNRDKLRPLRILSHLIIFLSELISCTDQHVARKPDARTVKVLAFIESRLDEKLTLGEIAEHVGVSKTWLVVQFTRTMGMPPMEYVLRRKMELAGQKFLSDPRRRVIDVAMELGFSSSQNFATVFKRYAGVSPQAFRRDEVARNRS